MKEGFREKYIMFHNTYAQKREFQSKGIIVTVELLTVSLTRSKNVNSIVSRVFRHIFL